MKHMRNLCILSLFVMMAGLMMFSTAQAKEPFLDNIGIDVLYGADHMLPTDLLTDHSFNRVKRLSFRAETRDLFFGRNWGWQLEALYAHHKIDEAHPDHGQDSQWKEYGINLILKYYFPNDLLYAGLVLGASYVKNFPKFENRDWSKDDLNGNLGHSGFLGTFGFALGKDWHVYRAWALRTEVRLTHTSDPFNSDIGKNYGSALVGVTYMF